jgi:hypothetical protein
MRVIGGRSLWLTGEGVYRAVVCQGSMNETASLIGRLGSSAFRLSTVAVSMSLARPLFSPESAPRALPIWDPKTRWNNLARGLAVSNTAGPSGFTNSPHPSSRDSAHRCHAPKATYPASPPTIPQRLWDCGARSRPAHPRLFPKAKGTNDRDGGMQSRLFASAWHVDPAPSAYQVLLYKANSATARTTQAKIPTPNAAERMRSGATMAYGHSESPRTAAWTRARWRSLSVLMAPSSSASSPRRRPG